MATLPTAESWNEGTEENVSIIRDCYCVNCNSSNGVTTVLPTKVPFFRQVIVMSFACNECNFRNSDVSFGGEIQLQGEIISLHVTQEQDLSRQIVKSDSASLTIPQLAFEIPPGTQRGSISTVEGMLRRAADNLDRLQPERLRLGDLDNFYRCQRVLQSLRFFVGVSENNGDDQRFPFDIILDDPAGNSFIENPLAPSADANLKSVKYTRSPHQDLSLGLKPAEAKGDNASRTKIVGRVQRESDDSEWEKKEVFKFPTTCPYCNHHVEANMCLTDIPHFRQVIIMSLLCENCGFRSNEIKGGGAIPKFGTKITVQVQTPEDLSREVLKSDTAGVVLPELKLELNEGGLDGLYTTIEGLLNKIHDRLEFANPFCAGDSAQKQHLGNDGGEFSEPSPSNARYIDFLKRLKDCADGHVFPFTIIISDPLSNSFVGPTPKAVALLAQMAEKEGTKDCYKRYVDPGIALDEYERTNQQNEALGLNDMKTENYQDSAEAGVNYGTDKPEALPDRLRYFHVPGPDHPHEVGKAPVEGDTTVMGAGDLTREQHKG